jgi:pyruvate dehydrogenase E2 component (dihydrolipoamide acetyltransferase)
MATEILMPALSPTMTEGKLAKWLVKEGDEVRAGDLIAEIETDKATMEVEAVDEGIVAKILVDEGSEGVAVNAVIAVLSSDGEALGEVSAPKVLGKPESPKASSVNPTEPSSVMPLGKNDDVKATPLARRIALQAGVSLSGIQPTGAGGKITKDDVLQASENGQVRAAPADGRVFASPLARKLAEENGLPLERIKGSGPNGRIVKADIERALKGDLLPVSTIETKMSDRAVSSSETSSTEFELVPHTSMRKTIARRLTESKQNVPHFYLTIDCEIDELLRVRKEMNARAPDGVKVSVNDFVIKALAVSLRRVPGANASWTEEGVRLYKNVDVSVAVALDGGLITPVVRNADIKGLGQISTDMVDLAGRARKGKLTPEEYQGGSISISNLGMFGIKQFDAVINPPQGAILAVGAGEQRPVVKNGELAVATVMTCTLSCDHRVIDGALGAELLQAFKSMIEFPAAMLL